MAVMILMEPEKTPAHASQLSPCTHAQRGRRTPKKWDFFVCTWHARRSRQIFRPAPVAEVVMSRV